MLAEVLREFGECGDSEVVTGDVSFGFGDVAESDLDLTCMEPRLGLSAGSL